MATYLYYAQSQLSVGACKLYYSHSNPRCIVINSKLGALNIKLGALNLKLGALNIKLGASNLKLDASNLKLDALNLNTASQTIDSTPYVETGFEISRRSISIISWAGKCR